MRGDARSVPSLYVSPPKRIAPRKFVYAVGTDPWNRYALEPGLIGEHARWWLALHARYQRWPIWKMTPPPRITSVGVIDIRPIDEFLGWLLTVWVLWRTLTANRRY